MTESMEYRLMNSSRKWRFHLIACGIVSLVTGTAVYGQTTPNRLPVIQSLNRAPGHMVINTREEPGKLTLGPVIEPAGQQQPGKVVFDGPSNAWSATEKPGTLKLQDSRPATVNFEKPGSLVLDQTEVQKPLIQEKINPGKVTLDLPRQESEMLRESEFKQRQRQSQQMNTVDANWDRRSQLPPAPPARLELKELSAPQPQQAGKLQLALDPLPMQPQAVPEFIEETVLPEPTFETSALESGSGKPGVFPGEEEFWVTKSFDKPEATKAAPIQEPPGKVVFEQTAPSEFMQMEPEEIVPDFIVEESSNPKGAIGGNSPEETAIDAIPDFISEEELTARTEVQTPSTPDKAVHHAPQSASQQQEMVQRHKTEQPGNPSFIQELLTGEDETTADVAAQEVTAGNKTAEIETAGLVDIALEKPETVKQVQAEESPFMEAMEQNKQVSFTEPQTFGDSATIQRPDRPKRRRGISLASYLEDFAEEGMESMPTSDGVTAWLGVNDGYYASPGVECPPVPEWSFRGEALYWHRSDPQGGEPLLIRVPSMAAPGSYIGNDVDYDNELGFRMRLERMESDGSGFDMEYFGVNDWSDTVRWLDERVIVLGVDIGEGSGAVTSDSELYSWEINGRRDLDSWTTLFGGFRFMNLDEYAAVSGAGDLQNVFASIDIANKLYGAQIGLDRTLFDNGGVLTIDMSANLGIFYNSIEAQTVNFPTLYDTEASAASLLRELNFNMELDVTDHISLIGGYTLMWLDDVALGPDQFLDLNNSVNEESNIFVHGGNLGMVVTW